MKSATDVGPGSDIFQRLLKERIVFIGSAIDQNTANLVCSQLILLRPRTRSGISPCTSTPPAGR